MVIEDFRAVYRREPFEPFAVHLADGRRIAVAERRYVAEFPNPRTVMVIQLDHKMNMIDLELVTDIEYSPAAVDPSKGNGSPAS